MTTQIYDLENVSKMLVAGANSDIWYDAHDHDDKPAESLIELTQIAMVAASEILNESKTIKDEAFLVWNDGEAVEPEMSKLITCNTCGNIDERDFDEKHCETDHFNCEDNEHGVPIYTCKSNPKHIVVLSYDFRQEVLSDMMEEITKYNKEEAEADAERSGEYPEPSMIDAMALWEAFLNFEKKFDDVQGVHGVCACRESIAELTKYCSRAYQIAIELGFDDSFDWEFCPWFLNKCVRYDLLLINNWENTVRNTFSK